MNANKRIAVLFVIVIVFSFLSRPLLSDVPKVKNLKKKRVVTGLKLRNRTITGIIFEDGVYGRNVRRSFGMFDSTCKRIYINAPDAVANTINSAPLHQKKVKVTISAADFIKKAQASSPQKALTALRVHFENTHIFTGRVQVVNCNDRYIDISYRFCTYGDYTVRIPMTTSECNRLNLQHNARVSVTARGWSYSPPNRRIQIARTVNIRVH